ncbi:DUF4347 domain-containing protein [Halomonas sp. RT37]|uniref:DUF4347 domain-containing protein n=1 Tax=Halomonas sp. RT37 TaxID=2950872 RepID=A0AAU7KBS5_9GAMM
MKGTRSRLIALEPRLLFDGAMAATPDPASDGDGGKPNQHQPTDGDGQAPATQADSPAGAGAPARHLVVVDARLSDAQRQTIREGLADDAELLEVDADENGIEAITAALAGMDQVESVEIFSHGASGQFQLGDTRVGNDTLTSLTASLGQWREALTADADLLLYGCRIGATDAGLELVEGLASATGMDVGASTDDTGHSGLGGDWELERQQGQMADDRGVALAALAPLDGLLADAEPMASLGESATEVPLGEEFQFTVSVSNASTAQEGYAPFVQLIVPATGKDGAGAEVDDGVIITSASYLGGATRPLPGDLRRQRRGGAPPGKGRQWRPDHRAGLGLWGPGRRHPGGGGTTLCQPDQRPAKHRRYLYRRAERTGRYLPDQRQSEPGHPGHGRLRAWQRRPVQPGTGPQPDR